MRNLGQMLRMCSAAVQAHQSSACGTGAGGRGRSSPACRRAAVVRALHLGRPAVSLHWNGSHLGYVLIVLGRHAASPHQSTLQHTSVVPLFCCRFSMKGAATLPGCLPASLLHSEVHAETGTCASAPSSAYRLPSTPPELSADAWLPASASAESRFSWMCAASGATIASGSPCFTQKAFAASCSTCRPNIGSGVTGEMRCVLTPQVDLICDAIEEGLTVFLRWNISR